MTASERVQLMREIKAEAKERRREAHLENLKTALKGFVLIALFVIVFLMAWYWDDAEAFAEGSKPSAISVHGGIKVFEEPEQPMFTEGEAMELMRVARAEAGHGVESQALVICVILNRVNDGRFGSSIHEVITAPNQFSTVASGAWLQEPNADTFEALELVRSGWDESQGALYFRAEWSGHFTWADYLFSYGGHNFYR